MSLILQQARGIVGQRQIIADNARLVRFGRSAAGLCLAASLLALGGCGTGVQFKGRLFQMAGLTGHHENTDPQLPVEAPLTLPPNARYLPPPGSDPSKPANANWPTNPEVLRQRLAQQKLASEEKKAAAENPENPYAGKPTIWNKLFHHFTSVPDSDVANVPAPDPSDSIPPLNGGPQKTQTSGYKPPTTDGLVPPPPPSKPKRPNIHNPYMNSMRGGPGV